MFRRNLRRFALVFAVFAGACALLVAYAAASVARETKGFVFDDVKQVPRKRVGLVLGCSSRLADGRPNPYFLPRVEAAVALHQAGVVEYLLLSGDNGSRNYDEPSVFKDALVANGVPADRLVLDYAGFRTLDSVIRAREVFGVDDFVVVSQRDHGERAVFLARRLGMNAVGYVAGDVTGIASFTTRAREWLARVKAVIDLKVGARPRFLGPKVPIGSVERPLAPSGPAAGFSAT
jgi:SanA protein